MSCLGFENVVAHIGVVEHIERYLFDKQVIPVSQNSEEGSLAEVYLPE